MYEASTRDQQLAARILGEGYAQHAFPQDHLAARFRSQQQPLAEEQIEEYIQFLMVRLVFGLR